VWVDSFTASTTTLSGSSSPHTSISRGHTRWVPSPSRLPPQVRPRARSGEREGREGEPQGRGQCREVNGWSGTAAPEAQPGVTAQRERGYNKLVLVGFLKVIDTIILLWFISW
jgi:hypothetical protein